MPNFSFLSKYFMQSILPSISKFPLSTSNFLTSIFCPLTDSTPPSTLASKLLSFIPITFSMPVKLKFFLLIKQTLFSIFTPIKNSYIFYYIEVLKMNVCLINLVIGPVYIPNISVKRTVSVSCVNCFNV